MGKGTEGLRGSKRLRQDRGCWIPYITKCSRPIVFTNFVNGANSRNFLSRILYAYIS